MMRRVGLCVVLLGIIFSGCSKYGFVSLNYPVSPQVYFPEHVKTVTLVNRSLTKVEDKQKKVVESVFTGEIAGSDKKASEECLRAVYDQMNGRMGMQINPSRVQLFGTGTRDIPELLDWKTVRSICDSTHADAILVLETFDSNSDLVLATVTDKVATVINGGTPKASLPNQIKMNVVCFWRLYDPSQKTIADQFRSTSYLTFNATGIGFAYAPPEALPNTAYAAGEEFIARYMPSYYTVRRDMYKKGKGATKYQFKAAFRAAEMAEWENAIEKWKDLVKNSNRKTAGRACLDIAVAYEVLGKTDLALEWVKKSYQDYNDKLGRDYAKILLNRKNFE
ncbi:MAG TPA: DUF6340 family protein [Bacteroidales bacterium]|nr:DUF6340 family protein [Bacteroidales bacterium]